MSFEAEQSLSRSTSRRTIVKTGAKLAYAAPLVAASLHMQSARANGVVSGGPTCTPSGQPCELSNPGACCSLTCINGTPPTCA